MKAFVHIGMPKCGSTAIRKWLVAYGSALADEGLLVLPDDVHHVSHSWMFRDFDAQFPDIGERKEMLAASYAARDSSWESLHAHDLARIRASDLTACVLSSEFFAFARDPRRLLDAFEPQDVHAIMFVRSQEEALDSAWYDLARAPGLAIGAARRVRAGWAMDFTEVENRWRSCGIKVDVLPHDGDVVARFRREIGSTSSAIPSSIVLHRTPPAFVVDYLFRRKSDHLDDPRWSAICDFFEEAFPVFESLPRGWCLDAETRADIRSRHANGNQEAVRRRPELEAALGRRDNWREAEFDAVKLERTCDLLFRRALGSAQAAQAPRPSGACE